MQTQTSHELHLLNKRMGHIDSKMSGSSKEVNRATLQSLNPDTRDLHSLIHSLQQLQREYASDGEQRLALERSILDSRIRAISAIRNLPRPFYDFGEPEFETLDALIQTLHYIRSVSKRR